MAVFDAGLGAQDPVPGQESTELQTPLFQRNALSVRQLERSRIAVNNLFESLFLCQRNRRSLPLLFAACIRPDELAERRIRHLRR